MDRAGHGGPPEGGPGLGLTAAPARRHHPRVRRGWWVLGLGVLAACSPESPGGNLDPSGANTPNTGAGSKAQTIYVSRLGGPGWVRSEPEGIACAPSCEADFPTGATVELVAEPLAGNVFIGWAGECAGTAPTCRVSMVGPRAVTAQFSGGSDAGVSDPDSGAPVDGAVADAGAANAGCPDGGALDGGC
jgi:hypothetical protein